MEMLSMDARMQELMNNKEFMDSVGKTTSMEEYQQLLAANGIHITIEKLKDGFAKLASLTDENGELSVEALDAVAGGRGVNAVSYLGFGGELLCTCILVAGASNPVGWFLGALACGAVALGSMI